MYVFLEACFGGALAQKTYIRQCGRYTLVASTHFVLQAWSWPTPQYVLFIFLFPKK